MAKTMAELSGENVVNLIWCSDNQLETKNLKNPGDRYVYIGDTYKDGKWYRNGKEILTRIEIAYQEIKKLQAEKAELELLTAGRP